MILIRRRTRGELAIDGVVIREKRGTQLEKSIAGQYHSLIVKMKMSKCNVFGSQGPIG